MTAKPIPDGYHTATPYLIVQNAAVAIEFYQRAFGATELMRLTDPGGKLDTRKSRSVTLPLCWQTKCRRWVFAAPGRSGERA